MPPVRRTAVVGAVTHLVDVVELGVESAAEAVQGRLLARRTYQRLGGLEDRHGGGVVRGNVIPGELGLCAETSMPKHSPSPTEGRQMGNTGTRGAPRRPPRSRRPGRCRRATYASSTTSLRSAEITAARSDRGCAPPPARPERCRRHLNVPFSRSTSPRIERWVRSQRHGPGPTDQLRQAPSPSTAPVWQPRDGRPGDGDHRPEWAEVPHCLESTFHHLLLLGHSFVRVEPSGYPPGRLRTRRCNSSPVASPRGSAS